LLKFTDPLSLSEGDTVVELVVATILIMPTELYHATHHLNALYYAVTYNKYTIYHHQFSLDFSFDLILHHHL
jgi:hypothetical protein